MSRRVLSIFCAFALFGTIVAHHQEGRATPKPGQKVAAARNAKAVEVLWGGQWWTARVIGVRKGFTRIHYIGWSSSHDEWVENHRVRVAGIAATPQGRPISILWGGKWWPGVELATRSGLHKVHYTGWTSAWDQWVEPHRIRPVTQVATPR